MRALTVLAAVALVSVAAPANAVLIYNLPVTQVTGTVQKTVVQSGVCPGVGICSVETVTDTLSIRGNLSDPISSGNQLTFSFGQTKPDIFGRIVVTYTGNDITDITFTGQGYNYFGSVGGMNGTYYEGVYSAKNVVINVIDTDKQTTRVLAAVPEPSTWAMMLLGFGAIGATLRRRRRSVAGLLAA